MLRVAVLDQEIVDCLRHLSGAVEPADADHQVVPLAPLELCYVADVEWLVGSLALYEDAVTRLVFDIVVVAAVAQVFASIVFPSLALAWLTFSCRKDKTASA
jgi:hypothetical protein